MLTVINSTKTLIAHMNGKHFGGVFQPLKVPHNAYHQKKKTRVKTLYHQRPNPEYCSHSHLPRGRAIIRPHVEQISGKDGSKSQQNPQVHQKIWHHILL